MMPSPSINPLPGSGFPFSNLPASYSPSSSNLTSSISLNSNRLITTNAIPIPIPITVKPTATLTEFPHAQTNTLRRQFKMIGNVKVDDNLGIRYDSRSNSCLGAGLIVSGSSPFSFSACSCLLLSEIGSDVRICVSFVMQVLGVSSRIYGMVRLKFETICLTDRVVFLIAHFI